MASLCLLAALAALVVFQPKDTESVSAIGPLAGSAVVELASELPGAAREVAEAPALMAFDAVELIGRHFGERADEALAALGGRGLDVSKLAAPAPESEMRERMTRWFTLKDGDREAQIESLLAWPEGGSSPHYLQRRYQLGTPLTAEDCEAIDALAGAYLPDVRFHAARYVDQLEASMQRAAQAGQYRLSPYISLPVETPADADYFVSTTKVGAGWVVELALSRQQCPEVMDAQAELEAVIAARDADIRASLEMLDD